MAKWTSKYGTSINIPNGLTPTQINEIKTQANNKFGTKAQQLATQYGANAKTPAMEKGAPAGAAATTNFNPANNPNPYDGKVPAVDTGIRTDGTVNGEKTSKAFLGAEENDTRRNVQLGNASEVDANGNKVNTVLNPDGTITRTQTDGAAAAAAKGKFEGALSGMSTTLDLNGQPKILQSGDYKANWDQNQKALYDLNTQHLDRNQGRDLEAQKQELANRGIVYNPGDSTSGYGKAIGSINEDYAGQRQTALNNSIAGADSRMATEAGVQSAAGREFLNSAQAKFDSGIRGVASVGAGVSALQGNFQPYQATSTDSSGELAKIAQLEQTGAISHQDAQVRREAIKKSGAGANGGGQGFQIT